MTNAAAIKSMREQFLEQSTDAEPNRYEIFAAMAEAYVAKTLETICKIDAANLGADYRRKFVDGDVTIAVRLHAPNSGSVQRFLL